MRRLAPALSLLIVALALLAVVACGTNPRAQLVVRFDAGSDGAAAEGSAGTDAALPPDASPYLGDPCVDDGQCNDRLPCTYDSCDPTFGRCLNVPDDTQCQDDVYCNGQERCVPGHGCEPGPVVSCDNGDACQLATCVESSKLCVYVERDVDQDGDPDAHCAPGHDCDDLNPAVSSLQAEVCANGVDDDCNGIVDETPCVTPQGVTCASAVAIPGPGSYSLSTLGATKTFSGSCSPATGQDVVAAITVPPGPNVDLDLWASSFTSVAVALDGTCGDPLTERACAAGGPGSNVRARAHDVRPGTYYAVLTTGVPATVALEVAMLAPSPPPTNVDCGTATPIQPGVATTVSLVDQAASIGSACPSNVGVLTYSFSLSQPQDVRVLAAVLQGTGTPQVGLVGPSCAAGEITCGHAESLPLFKRALPAGTYVVTVGATSSVDATVEVQLSPPSVAPPDQTCDAPPALVPDGTLAFDLASHEIAIHDQCFLAGPTAAYDSSLPVPSDVLVIARFPENESGAVSLDDPACTSDSTHKCSISATPARAGVRNLAGDYRVVVSDQLGLPGKLDALVRPTVAPTDVGPGEADTCAQAVDVSQGGFFTGDTSKAHADYGMGCDAPGQPAGGAPDQVLALNLTRPSRVVLDMEGSLYTTILDVRQGPACPGTPILGGVCYVGFSAQRSFLDLGNLPAGSYWVLIDGYSGQNGLWNLDVRILPP